MGRQLINQSIAKTEAEAEGSKKGTGTLRLAFTGLGF